MALQEWSSSATLTSVLLLNKNKNKVVGCGECINDITVCWLRSLELSERDREQSKAAYTKIVNNSKSQNTFILRNFNGLMDMDRNST